MFILPYVSDIGKLFSKYSHTILQLPHNKILCSAPFTFNSDAMASIHASVVCKCHLPEESGSISSSRFCQMQKLPPGFSAARRTKLFLAFCFSHTADQGGIQLREVSTFFCRFRKYPRPDCSRGASAVSPDEAPERAPSSISSLDLLSHIEKRRVRA